MSRYPFSLLSDSDLLRALAVELAGNRVSTATIVALIAEVDARRLFVPAGYDSMYAFCVEELRLSEDAASKRIQVARAARKFPAIFEALADGRLHLTGVNLLAPWLTTGNAEELLGAAAHKTKAGIEALLAARFPRSESLGLVVASPAPPAFREQHAPSMKTGCQR